MHRQRWYALTALALVLVSAGLVQANPNARMFDWSQYGVATPVRDQGDSQNCWAVAATEALEANWAIRHKRSIVLSPQPVLDRTHQNGPDRVSRALDVLQKFGTTLQSLYPYTHLAGALKNIKTPFRANRWAFINKDASKPSVAQMKKMMSEHGPLAVGVQTTARFKSFRGSGVYRESVSNKDPNSIDHMVLLVGWDDTKGAWKLKNSWGTQWGNQGYMWIAYNSNHVGSNAAWVECVR
jgi:cathepsin L